MKKTFTIDQKLDSESSPFDRQQRIDWLDQTRISNARVMVVGAGAIGNETLKNLALLGFKNVFIVDFDVISMSNLSRTVLFRRDDLGKRKAEVAAERFKEMCLASDARVDWYHGDLVWDIGSGIYEEMDIVLGCLDNVETRFSVNRNCWIANRPWIDAGINELGLHLTVYKARTEPCYNCRSSASKRRAARLRYSCDAFKRESLQEGKIPTVQVTSAIASGLQVQETIKLLCNHQSVSGVEIVFQGGSNYFDLTPLGYASACDAHIEYADVSKIMLDNSTSLRSFLEHVASLTGRSDSILDFTGDLPDFVLRASCRGGCGKEIEFYRPIYKILDAEVFCEDCQGRSDMEAQASRIEKLCEFGLGVSDSRTLSMSLASLGVPYGHKMCIRDANGNLTYYELMGDRRRLLPNIVG